MAMILVIEDDRVQRLVTARTLQKAGHDVLEAVDGEQGLTLARTHKPDLIVCDVMMPGMDGYAIVRALRQSDPAVADTPVIMLTALSERADMRTGMNAGADDYLTKPFSAVELTEAVTALLAKRQAQRDAIVNLMKSEIVEALDEQKQELARQYERRFIEELNARWDRGQRANGELRFDNATVLVVDLFAALRSHSPGGGQAAVRRAYDSARDNLYLFGARHLLAYGEDLLAIFADAPEDGRPDARASALRAAFALQKALAGVLVATGGAGAHFTVAVHQGPVTLLHVSDPLHGDPDATLATGETLTAVQALRAHAQKAGWRVACSRRVVDGLPVRSGREEAVPGTGDAVELLGAT